MIHTNFCLNADEKRGVGIENASVEVLVSDETWFDTIKRVSFRLNVDGETRYRCRNASIEVFVRDNT